MPTEILPLVQNLNQFFTRTSEQLERERRFVSDAAHELRSPLAALRIQTEVAQLAEDDAQTREMALAAFNPRYRSSNSINRTTSYAFPIR